MCVRVALFILALLAAPLAAEAQPTGKVCRIAFVHPSMPVADMIKERERSAFFSELRRLGYVEGKNLIVERRSAEGRNERYPEIVAEVTRLKPDLIVAISTPLVRRFKTATTTIPIVGTTSDPVASGLVANLSRPGGNITGFSIAAGDEMLGKQLELLREAAPNASRVALLTPRPAGALEDDRYHRVIREAGERLGLTLVFALLDSPIQEREYRRAFDAMAGERAQALFVSDLLENFTYRRVIVELARRARLPAIYPYREFVDVGGLLSYGVNNADLFRQVAGYVDRILKGANPGDLPYQLPTKFELVINLKTAKALGQTIPQSLLLRADQVIESSVDTQNRP
jgi:putative tryptophan/tyrosine transport system substrate-binding protein